MDNGYIIIGIIVLLFMSMYGYAYVSMILDHFKSKRFKKKLIKLREKRRLITLNNQTERDDKLLKLITRSEEIRQELRDLQLKKDMRLQMAHDKMNLAQIKTHMNEKQVG